jgi:hypothetical protein
MYTGWDRYKKDTNDKGQKYKIIKEKNEEYVKGIREYFVKENEEKVKELEELKRISVQERNQERKMEKFIELSWKNWKENQKEGNQNQKKGNQGNQKEGQQESPEYQKVKERVYRRIQPHRDKRLLQIDKWKNRYWILLIEAYLSELLPNHKQQRFVSWYWKRKGKQKWRRKEKETIESSGRDNESNYSNHEEGENNAIYSEKIYSEKLQAQGSSLLFRTVKENSKIYKKFKIYIREAYRIFSTSQRKASRDRHLKEAKALLETDMEKVGMIYFLREILKAINSSKGSRTRSLLRKILEISNFKCKFNRTLEKVNREKIQKIHITDFKGV